MRKQSSIIKTIISGFGLWMACFPGSVWASVTAVHEWETLAQKIVKSLTGPMAFYASVIAIVVCGLIMAFGDLQAGAKNAVSSAIGISIAVGAIPIVKSFFGFTGALI